ncbi:MAG: efflux RND transporter permease subunit [Bacteroidetes bacterium]|nr:efflux RND transporter permease subunit [Bacteroidota bacterium]
MKKLVTLFVKYPFYANIIIAAILIGGIMSLISMKKSFFPEMEARNIFVNVTYPGASPIEMEEGVTVRIEEALRGLAGIKEINSTSSENFSSVVITTTGEYDIDETLMEAKNAVDGISSFPVSAERPIVFKQRASSMAMFLGMSGDVNLLEIKKHADKVELDLRASGVMSQIMVGGYPALEISIETSEDDLRRYNLTIDEIVSAVSLNNRDMSGGLIKSDEEEMSIRLRSRSVDPEKIGNIILRANPDGSYLRIKDIATIDQKFADVASSSMMNGKPSISFSINKLIEEDLVEISDYCKDYVKKFNEQHTEVQMYITYDFDVMLGARLSMLYRNGGIGLALILITLGLFLSFRLSLWVAWGIPASFLAMFVLAAAYGITINMISVFGMILVVGILVDDGIVIAENIYAHFEGGKSPRRAAIDGTMEVLPAVLTSVTTTIVAFAPLLLIKNQMMQFMFEMAFIVIFSLLFSLLEAFFVLPAHLSSKHILRSKKKQNIGMKVRNKLDMAVLWMRDKIYGKVLRGIINSKWVVSFIPLALIIITMGLFNGGLIKTTFFPSIPFDQFNVNIAFKPGSGEKRTKEYLERFDQAIWEVNDELKRELNDTVDLVNFTFASTGSAFNGLERGSHAGSIFVILRDLENSGTNSFMIVNRLREKIGKLPEAEKFTIAGRNTFGTPISISLLGDNLAELNAAKNILMENMNSLVSINNVMENNGIGMQEVLLELTPKAYFLGLTQMSLTNQVRQGFFGGQAQRLQQGKDELRVWVRYPKSDRLNIGQLENMKIKTRMGDYPLSELASYKIERGPVSIKRYNGQKEIRITADPVNPTEPIPPIMAKISTEFVPAIQVAYPSVEFQLQGQSKDAQESGMELAIYFGLAFIIISFILMTHFKSFGQGIIVLIMIPLGWLGGVWGHGIEGIPVSMLSAWGLVALSGVIINDAVVFLTKYNLFLTNGNSVKEAVYKAGISRFRPIILTTITTSVGLYPIIFESSFQAQFLKPMAVSLAYGVFVGTTFILILFPITILLLNDLNMAVKWLWTGIRPTPEEVEKAVIYSKRQID